MTREAEIILPQEIPAVVKLVIEIDVRLKCTTA